jgi:predicted GNAT family acetyltransferase
MIARYPHYKLFVAEDAGRIVGTYAFLFMHNLGHLGAPSAIVEDVAVDPASQGRGIGQAMMRHAVERARDLGCYKLMLSSNIQRGRAHAFYDQLGFERHGISFRISIDVGARISARQVGPGVVRQGIRRRPKAGGELFEREGRPRRAALFLSERGVEALTCLLKKARNSVRFIAAILLADPDPF